MFAGPAVPSHVEPIRAPSPSVSRGPNAAPPSPKGHPEHHEPFGTLVRDAMQRSVITVSPDDTLRTATTLLARKGISGLPVVGSEGKVVGVLSEKDVLRVLREKGRVDWPGGLFDILLETSEARQRDFLTRCRTLLDGTLVKAAMSSPAKTIRPDVPTIEAARIMIEARINRLPVVEAGKLVGIVSRRDVLALYVGPT